MQNPRGFHLSHLLNQRVASIFLASLAVGLILPLCSAFADQATLQRKNDPILAQVYVADQVDRQALHAGNLSREQMEARDRERRKLVMVLLQSGKIQTSDDYFAAAMVFQHGESPADYRMAHALSTLAARLSTAPTETTWLMAATWDRLMRSLGHPQWYGTQYSKDSKGNLVLQPIDLKAVPDTERRRLRIFLPDKK